MKMPTEKVGKAKKNWVKDLIYVEVVILRHRFCVGLCSYFGKPDRKKVTAECICNESATFLKRLFEELFSKFRIRR